MSSNHIVPLSNQEGTALNPLDGQLLCLSAPKFRTASRCMNENTVYVPLRFIGEELCNGGLKMDRTQELLTPKTTTPTCISGR
jgi:hypothetical protein